MRIANLHQLRWRCRRGMRELDLLLVGHLERHGADLGGAELQLFERLLEQTDIDLYHWFTGREMTTDNDLASLVARILGERGLRVASPQP